MWIKSADGKLFDTTSAAIGIEHTVVVAQEGRTRTRSQKAGEDYSVCHYGVTGNTSIVASGLSEADATAAMGKIEDAIMRGAPLVEI